MNKYHLTFPAMIAGLLLTPVLSFADAQLNQCLSQNKGDPNVYKICYGQKKSRAQQQRANEDNARLQATTRDVEDKTIQILQSVSQQKDKSRPVSIPQNVYSTPPPPRPAPITRTPVQQPVQQQTVQQPTQPATPKKDSQVIQYY